MKARLLTIIFSFLLSVLSLAAEACVVNPLGLQSYAAVSWIGSGPGSPGENVDNGCVVVPVGNSPVPNQASSVNAFATALTSYGINSASISGNLTTGGSTTNSAAWSTWRDTLTVVGGTGTGQVIFGAHVSGSFTFHTDVGFALEIIDGTPGFNGTGFSLSQFYNNVIPASGNFSLDVFMPYNFTYNQPFDLAGELMMYGNLNSLCCGGHEGQPPFSTVFSASLNSVVLPDGASLESLSGALFPATVSAVPEPSTWAMMLIGFAGLGFMAYRRSLKTLAAA